MTGRTFGVTIYRVNEGEHQSSQETFKALDVSVLDDGSVSFETPEGRRTFGATTWGRFEFVRVAGG